MGVFEVFIGLLLAIAVFFFAWAVAGWGGGLVLLVVLTHIIGRAVASWHEEKAASEVRE